MKPEHADQDELQRMLALKRHEQPPQRFFKGLSNAVIDRIQHPGPPPPPTLLQRMGLNFDTKPVLVCLSGAAVCALLVFGLVQSRNAKAPEKQDSGDASAIAAGAPASVAKPAEVSSSTAPVMVKSETDRIPVQPRPVKAN